VGDKPSAGFVDLCYNYLQERLQFEFNNSQVDRLDEKEKELAKLMISKKSSSSPMINLIDRTNCLEKSTNKASWSSSGTQTLGRRRSSSSRGVRFNQTPPGLFTLLHKATSCPWSDDRTFVHRLFGQWGGGKGYSLIEKSGEAEFTLKHLQGTNPVRYSATGWRHVSYNMGRTNLASELLRKSEKEYFKCEFNDPFNHFGFGYLGQNLSLDEVKSRMSCLQVKVQIDTILRVISKTQLNFVLCIQPHHLSGLCELFREAPGQHLSQKLLRDQLRGHQILDYILFIKELKKINALATSKQEALSELANKLSSSFILSESNTETAPGLGSNLWQGLQVAMFSAVTNLDILEQAVTSIRTGVSSMSSSIPAVSSVPPAVLDDTRMLLLQNGKVILSNFG